MKRWQDFLYIFTRLGKKLRLYYDFAKLETRSVTIYRSAFWIGFIGQILGYGATFATLYIVIVNFQVLDGWNGDEVLFLYAMYLLSYALGACFFFNPCTRLAANIRTGEFDNTLTKPLSPFAHEFFMGFNFGYVSHVSLSVAVLVFCIVRLHLEITPISILVFAGLLIGAVLTQCAILIFSSAFSFLLITNNPVFNLMETIKQFIHYPLSMYPAALQFLLTFVIPIGFINFYPIGVVLRKKPGQFIPPFMGYLTPLAGIVLLLLSIAFWNWALSKYQSTGN
jgi:ABC-2 type transport system permease protein